MNELNINEITSTKWIENLALDEINMDESGIIDIDGHLDPSYMLEESSINFMNAIRDRFEVYTNKFNEYRGSQPSTQIKIFKISNTVNDFMLFRNSLRLIFARKASDLISIGFISGAKDIYSPRMKKGDMFGEQSLHEIRAHVGPFNNITWRYNGEIVEVDAMVKHYLSEFIKNSAR